MINKIAPRTQNCLDMLNKVLHLDGDVIEVGANQGFTTAPLALLLKDNNINKKIYACDTFKGIPEDDIFDIKMPVKKGECRCSYDKFWDNMISNSVTDLVIPVEGIVEETVPL